LSRCRRIASLLVPWVLVACSGGPLLEPSSSLSSLPASCTQVLVVRSEPGRPQHATVQRFERARDGWHELGTMAAMVGRSGIVAATAKREGDGGTPAGVHTIGPAFGYAATCATKLAYRQATAQDWWIDEPGSPAYNTWVTGKPAVSAEAMRRDDAQYELGAVLGWNTSPVVPGRGSAIFLHVWQGPDEPTSGCVALARSDVATLLAWLDAGRDPRVVVIAAE
jgi:L,D-peptidoglycan transpeptidase YkuD (ErfK/YbiS/YcfS/YnhG family)